MPKRLPFLVGAIAVVAMCLVAVPAVAQFGGTTGGIHGKVTDEQGGVLPGVSVTVKGPGAPQTVYTDARGEFHVVNLSPGVYTLTLALQGFTTVNREHVDVALGRDTELPVTMKLSSVAATVTVSGEVPVIDTRKVQAGAAVTQEELKAIPTSRDPWVVMQTIPGVQIDRINVAGSESGQQSNMFTKGAQGATFQVDGVNLTDMSALGSSAAYYDFVSFQEMQVITGGSDPSVQGSSAHLNMITKRGTNELHGNARVFAVDQHFQSENKPAEVGSLASGNHIQSIQDYGADAGGPVWKDRIWLWGAYGRDQINLVSLVGAPSKTTLEDFNAKLNWQIVPSNSAEVWYLRSDKQVAGRGHGSASNGAETLWNQILPQNTWKIQDSQVLGSSFFASATYSGLNGDFVLSPQGGFNTQAFYDPDGVWHNTYELYRAPRPQRSVKADMSYFFNTGGIGHEVKAGFTYQKSGVQSFSSWPPFETGIGNNLAAATYGDQTNCSPDANGFGGCAVITRNGAFGAEAKYWGAYIGDTITMDRLTFNLGVRWDEQYGTNNPSIVPGNPSFPDIMPAFNYPGAGKQFTWKNWEPRAGITYALGQNRSTVFKASYAQYAEALGTATVSIPNNSAGAGYAYYLWNDLNHDNFVQPGEVDTSANGFQYSRNFNPADPSNPGIPANNVSSQLQAPYTWEIIGGVEHEVLPAFAVGVTYTHRHFRGFIYGASTLNGHTYDPNTGTLLTSADYHQFATLTGTSPGGTSFSEPVYAINQSVLDALGGAPSGYLAVNRPNFNETYDGVEATLTKRLANRWMARASFTYNNNKQHVGEGACIDPTNLKTTSTINAQTCRDNDLVTAQSTGSGGKSAVFLNSKWQFNVVGMYQLPLGFNIAANLYGRQGYPINYYITATGGGDKLTRDVVVVPADSDRYPDVVTLDMRLEKVMNISQTATLTVSADCFNVTNAATVLQRQNKLGNYNPTDGFTSISSANTIREIISPRIWRFGARISF
ncbi:MAG: carboxypeptidase regulatory-like domain-containing protein [Acidobacteriota bacterium]